MKIKEVSAGVKVSKNYDSYQAGLVAEVEVGENPEKVGESLMEKSLAIVSKQIEFSGDEKLPGKEVGAAWSGKKFKDRLSVKNSETGVWSEVKIKDLQKTGDGYLRETDEGTFVFRKIPEEKRTNSKMPLFRIYKAGGNV